MGGRTAAPPLPEVWCDICFCGDLRSDCVFFFFLLVMLHFVSKQQSQSSDSTAYNLQKQIKAEKSHPLRK